MTDSVGRHAAGRESAETLIIPVQGARGRTARRDRRTLAPPACGGRHASSEPAGPARARERERRAGTGTQASAHQTARRSHWAWRAPTGTAWLHGPGVRSGGPAPRPERHKPSGARGERQLRLVWVYPDLLSTYGDRGNLLVLSRRAQLRGIEVEAIEVNSDQPVPTQGDIYLLGGGEDLPQILAANRLRADGGLARAAGGGAVVFAVCAGYQVIGDRFGGVEGEAVAGLGILDISSGRGDRRGVGELVADADPALSVPRLTGFENHQGVTRIGSAARPLAEVSLGVGNGDGTEGAYGGKVLGTYMHGPALVRNPGLADLLLSWAVGNPEATRSRRRGLGRPAARRAPDGRRPLSAGGIAGCRFLGFGFPGDVGGVPRLWLSRRAPAPRQPGSRPRRSWLRQSARRRPRRPR